MNESILVSIKKLIGLDEEYEVFDPDIITYINSAFVVLNQLGVGDLDDAFHITGKDETWSDFGEYNSLEMLKSYIAKKVLLMFDPPSSSSLLESTKNQIAEFEFRTMVGEENV